MPLDEGFNRLAWLFPYLLGISGAVVVGTVAFRWSSREASVEGVPLAATVVDAKLAARLDDELRNLD